MLQIIKIEWLKVKNYRTFWVFIALGLLSILAPNFIIHDVFIRRIPKDAQKLLGQPIYDFPLVWQTVASVGSYTSGIFGLLLITLVTNEFTYRTHRQNIIDGWDRRDFVLSKLFWVVSLALVAFLTSLIAVFIFGGIYGSAPFSLENSHYLFYYLLQVIVSLLLALLLAMLVKRTGLAIILFVGYVMFLEQLLVFIAKRNFGNIGGLFPLQAGDELLPFPVLEKVEKLADPNYRGPYDNEVYLATLIIYIALIIWVVFRRMLRTDL
ncbi:ABC transporter permease [Chitinophaga sp. CF418]|uniref:ABC transporter permease n=1 Tax=Chitinophaga sp. CF418 TaxID=1855287 RepID=UPI000923BFC9|nr:ABC transporter permease [Chitinophaga sp. CF418]SHM12031.1 ABC-2 family transporter protein [Chitinophaga sp. CF418]